MSIYRIKITTAAGARLAHTGIYVDGVEAVLQTLADWPGARSVSAICVRRSA